LRVSDFSETNGVNFFAATLTFNRIKSNSETTISFLVFLFKEMIMNFPPRFFSIRSIHRLIYALSLSAFFSSVLLHDAVAQEPPKPDQSKTPPDVIIFRNGDQLTGEFSRVVDNNVTFHSQVAGDVTVSLDQVKELRSSKRFAVIYKQQKISRDTAIREVPVGSVSIENHSVQVHPETGPQPAPIAFTDVADVIDSQVFIEEVRHEPSIFSKWTGTFTFGSSNIQATQNNNSVNGGVALSRTIPSVSYLPSRDRETIDFTASYGNVTQPGIPKVKTAIYHADAERDRYFKDGVYVLGQVAFDHNFSQSLDLQQIYGGGIGWTAIKTDRQQLDLKATLHYGQQSFIQPSPTLHLVGSTFGASYLLKLPKGMLFSQQVNYLPAWNQPEAYSINETNSLSIPFYKQLSVTLGTLNTYLNNPPPTIPPTKRNSFQFTSGISYTLR
jgi:Protein of unknown function, DUF481